MKTALRTIEKHGKIDLKKIDTGDSGRWTKDEAKVRCDELRERLAVLQEALYAEGQRSLLIVFQAMDTGGKDGATKNLLRSVNPAGVAITSFKAPTAAELKHDYLWRIHAAVPARGFIGVWNRSHYEDVLIVRVHEIIDEHTCEQRYRQINDFEKMLAENGTTILKFFLHISKDEQKERLQARLDTPERTWKFNPTDLKERALWSEYRKAYENALSATSTAHAPWYIVPADKKWARDIAVTEKVVETLEAMKPAYPHPDFDPRSIVID